MVTGENKQIVATENVCVADEPKYLCIIRDMVDTQSPGRKYTINLPGSVSGAQFITEVAKISGYVADSISVKYERTGPCGEFQEISMEDHVKDPLLVVCTGASRRQDFTIGEREGVIPQKAEMEGVQATSCSTGGFTASVSDTQTYTTYSAYNSDYSNSYASAFLKSDTGYVGLVNQAMTCYLNSLLQTLFMTPEFRNALYRWEFDGSEEEMIKSIPYQLQRLFLLLQTSKKKAVETTDVTKSFGWDSSEAWQQHDVQELCRVMFDALELKWRNTDQANLINHLYQGKMKDYVKCLQCGTESARIDAYLDIPLVIRPFGSNQSYGSVDEALKAFVQPETLDGTNQYFCEKCNKKCDAHKGLKFESFPYLLTLQLKRFDFDYSTMHRIKLNDRMSFPEILDLNNFTKDDPGGCSPVNQEEFNGETEFVGEGRLDDPEEELKTMYHGETDPATLSQAAEHVQSHSPVKDAAEEGTPGLGYSNGPLESGDEGIDEGIDVGNCASGTSSISDSSSLNSEAAANDRNTKESGSKGPYVYELFSIMIHSGNAAGGHYYAYIKSFKDGQWYGFNDQQVSRITYDDIRKTYGGVGGMKGYYSAAYASSTNAYMLMYRQIDKQKNADFMQPENFPEHLKNEMQKLKDKEEAEKRQREIDRSTCKIKLYCCHPSLLRKMDVRFEIHKDKTLREATEMAHQMFELDGIVPLDCCRLVKYDDYHDSLERSFDQEEDTTMGVLLGGVKSSYTFDLLLETKRPDQVFQEYKPGGVTVKVFVVDLEGETIEPPVSVRASHSQTVAEFKHLISQTLGVNEEHMKCVLERYHNDLRLLTMPTKSLKSEGFFRSNKVYIECSGTEDPKLAYPQTKLYRLLDRHQNTIRIIVNLPKQEEVEELIRSSRKQTHYSSSNMQNSTNSVMSKSVSSQTRLCNDDAEIDEGIGDSEIDFKVKTISIHTCSHSDPCVYRSCELNGDALVHHTKVRTVSPVNLSLNGDSTSTSVDSAFTSATTMLVRRQSGSLTELGQGDHDLRQPIEHDTCDFQQSYSQDKELSAHGSVDAVTSTAYEHGTGDVVQSATEDWDAEIAAEDLRQNALEEPMNMDDEEYRKYFLATPFINPDTGERSLTVYVDKRITLGSLKNELEPYVGTTAENFKVYRVYSNNQEFENTRLSENLSFLDDGKLNIKLGRALKPGEYRVKVYQLLVNESEPSKYLIDTIFAKGMTVLESKEMILYEVKEQCGLDIPLDRCRLRKKTWKNPGTIYTDSQVYEDDIPIYANWEIFLEVLSGPEEMVSIKQLALYVKRWRPSKMELDPFQEIVLSQQTVQELKNKISDISGIEPENIEFAKGRGTFPCEVSVLEIHTDLDWDPQATTLPVYPLYISDDGSVIFYRDKTEELAELSEDRKKEIQQKENVRLSRIGNRVSYSPRKERALKIYTDEHPSNSSKISIDLD